MYAVGLDEAVSASDYGYKASAISGLRKVVPVPDGFVVTVKAFESFLSAGGLYEKMEALKCRMDASTMDDIRKVEGEVRSAFLSVRLPKDIESAISKFYENLSLSEDVRAAGTAFNIIQAGRVHEHVAVRPSVIRKPEDTFAGILDSFVNIVGEEDLMRAIKLCWASLFYPRAARYTGRKSLENTKVCVIIQKMANAEKSGMMLTGFGSNKILVEASWGPGNAASSGIVTPDEYLLDSEGKVVEKNISKKLWMFERNEYTGATSKVYVPVNKMSSQVLSDPEIGKLFELCGRIGAGLGQLLIDWSIGRNRVMITDVKNEKYEILPNAVSAELESIVSGRFVSSGTVVGKVRRVDYAGALPKSGDVMVLESSDAGIFAVSGGVSAIVADEGGRLCNMGILAREFGIPALSATHEARSVLAEGQDVKVLADVGKVLLHSTIVQSVQELARGEDPSENTRIAGDANFGITREPDENGASSATDEIEKILIGVSDGNEPAPRRVKVFGRSSPAVFGVSRGVEGFIFHNSGEPKTAAPEGYDYMNSFAGLPVWVSCSGDKDLQWATSLARNIAGKGQKDAGVIVPAVRGKEDIEKYRYSMPHGAKLGVNVKTPAIALSPDAIIIDGVEMVNIDVDSLLQLSMGLQRPDHHIHKSVMEMVERVVLACSSKGILCCATLGNQYVTDWNVESLVKIGVGAICVDPPSVESVKGMLKRLLSVGKSPEVNVGNSSDDSQKAGAVAFSLLETDPSSFSS